MVVTSRLQHGLAERGSGGQAGAIDAPALAAVPATRLCRRAVRAKFLTRFATLPAVLISTRDAEKRAGNEFRPSISDIAKIAVWPTLISWG
jgi:hypothetical protein